MSLFQRETLQPHALSERLHNSRCKRCNKPHNDADVMLQPRPATWTDLHAVCEHDADGHQLGEDPEQLRVGQHAVLQAVVQEAGVVAENVIDV